MRLSRAAPALSAIQTDVPWYREETGHEQASAFPLPLWERVPRQGRVRGRINIDTENVGANEKLFNHGDTAGTAKSKKRKSFLSLLFAVPAVSPWLTAFSI
ncbi:hypothetical protein AGMMS50256_10190 [Betaproteobacteria bacterium]|nr:hypothetical protein AGMMS50256_10190 [Betaproteobacteria bacterium]